MAKNSGRTRGRATNNDNKLSQKEIDNAKQYGFEIYKTSDTPQFGKKLTYHYEVSHDYDALNKIELEKAKSIAEEKGGHYDYEFEVFVMPNEQSANGMIKSLLKIKKK